MREIETQLEQVKVSCQKNEGGLLKVQEDVTKLAAAVESQSKKVEEAQAAAATAGNSSIFEELRQRESRKANVIMHGMGEAPPDHVGRARWDWDMKSCENIFAALHIPVKAEQIRFVRRVGEAGPHPRPLVVGFHDEQCRARVLRADTRRSVFSDVDIVPDLTKAQRKEEDDLRTEMVNRNRAMCSEDRAKNLAWVVVGPRGAKRLVKKYVDAAEEMAAGRRLPRRRTEGTGRESHPASRLATGGNREPVGREEETMDAEVVEDLAPPEMRGRLGSKRGRGESADADEPPQARQKQ
jgi:hypothetical protein